jgi:hypothetical protein
VTFHFGAPYFIKDIEYDLAALRAARPATAPEAVATQEIENQTSLEQNSEYARDLEVEKTTTPIPYVILTAGEVMPLQGTVLFHPRSRSPLPKRRLGRDARLKSAS